MDIKREKTTLRGGHALALLKTFGIAAAYVLVAVILGRAALPFGAKPLGIALLCASGVYTPATLAGLCLSVIGIADAYLYLAAYALCTLLRLTVSLISSRITRKREGADIVSPIFCECAVSRAIIAVTCVFLVELYKFIRGELLYYYLFGMLVSVVIATLGALLWYPVAAFTDGRKSRSVVYTDVGNVSLIAAIVYSLKGLAPYGVSLSMLVAMGAVLLITRKRGLALGSVTAIAAGLCVSVTYAPLFVFAAICYGFLYSVSPTLASLGAFAAGIMWGIYVDGVGAILSLAPALMASTFIFFVADRLFLSNKASLNIEEGATEQSAEHKSEDIGGDIAIARLDDAARRIKRLCEGMSSLSEALLGSDGAENERARVSSSPSVLSAEIGDEGVVVSKSTLRADGRQRAAKTRSYEMDELAENYGCLCGASVGVCETDDRTEGFALDLAAVSDYLATIMMGNDSYCLDGQLTLALNDALSKRFSKENVRASVFEGRDGRVMLSAADARTLCAYRAEICECVKQVCGFSARAEEPFEMGDRAYMMLYRRPVLDAVYSGKRKSAPCESEFCGDSIGIVRDDNGRAFAYISDGMGSGKAAARTSELCAMFLDKLLPIDSGGEESVKNALSVINGFLRARNNSCVLECSATVDLGVLDLLEGKACFYKSGAAPTYVFRDGSLFKLRARTVPVGIVKQPDLVGIKMDLLPEDVIVMVSDGVTQGREECPELFELLRTRLGTHNADQLADAVIEYASELGYDDDVSVVVIKIREALFE